MTRLTITLAAAVLLSMTSLVRAEDGNQPGEESRAPANRADLVATLREHLAAAARKATLSDQQHEKLRKAGQNLSAAESAFRKGGMLNPIKMFKMRGTLGDIEKLAKSDVFTLEHRELLLEDIRRLREVRKKHEGQ